MAHKFIIPKTSTFLRTRNLFKFIVVKLVNQESDMVKTNKNNCVTDKKQTLKNKIREMGVEQKTDSGFEFVEVSNPQTLLEWAVVSGYVMHGSTRKILGGLVPQKANDLRVLPS